MKKSLRGENGQALPLVAMLLIVLVGLIGLAIDVGRIYIARAELSRALDAAALAGVLDLPDVDQARVRATVYMHENLPSADIDFPATSDAFQFRVHGSRTIDLYFMRMFGFGDLEVDAQAAAGFGLIPVDTVLLLDATGSMGASPCNGAQDNPGCPIKEARDAANGFVDILLGGTNSLTQVGYAPYRGCYNPPRLYANCVPAARVIDLTDDDDALHAGINTTNAQGGTGTNNCLALFKGREMFQGPGAQTGDNVLKVLVILTDGDNTYNATSWGEGQPPADCRPTTDPSKSDGYTGTSCRPAQTRERQLDVKTKQLGESLEAMGVEIYVVGLGVCGKEDSAKRSTPDYCNGIGNGAHDNEADRRLLKCIASSTDGTNDHYFEVDSATELPDVFGDIARAIAFRLIE